MEIKNLQIEDYIVNTNISNNEVIGFFSKKKHIVTEFLLLAAGINRSKDSCFYEEVDIYDNSYYFSNRLYIDCSSDLVQTLNVEKIIYAIKFAFNKNVNKELLEHLIKQLAIRGETEITLALEYIFSPVGRTLINMALGLSINNHLIINNPTINLTKVKDIDYLKMALKNHSGFKILGLDDYYNLIDILDRMIVFTDFNSVIEYDPHKMNYYLIEDCIDIRDYRLFKAYGNRVITIDIPRDILKKCDRNRIRYEKVHNNEIKKHIFN